jgi:hypothetical protein
VEEALLHLRKLFHKTRKMERKKKKDKKKRCGGVLV